MTERASEQTTETSHEVARWLDEEIARIDQALEVRPLSFARRQWLMKARRGAIALHPFWWSECYLCAPAGRGDA